MHMLTKGFAHLFAHHDSFLVELEGYGESIVVREGDFIRSNSYVELIVNHKSKGRVLITIPLSDSYMERALQIENWIEGHSTTLFTQYRTLRGRISHRSSTNESLVTRVIVQHLPEGELLCRYLERASYEQIQTIYGALRLLEANLRAAKISFVKLNAGDLIVGDDGLLYPIRYYRLRFEEGDISSVDELVKRIEQRYGINEEGNNRPPTNYTDRDQLEGYLYSGVPHEDRVVVEDISGFGYVDGDNIPVIEAQYLWADDFREGRAEVECQRGFGLIDIDGMEVIPPIYESLGYNPNSGITSARLSGKWAYFSYVGKQLTEFTKEYPDEELTLSQILTSR